MKKEILYKALAVLLQRRHTLDKRDEINPTMVHAIDRELTRLVREHLPSGSGFDNGTTLIDDACFRAGQTNPYPSMLVFSTAFHHMDEHGGYVGWTEHMVYVRPCFSGIDLTVSGKNKNQIKDYIGEEFYRLLMSEVDADTGVME